MTIRRRIKTIVLLSITLVAGIGCSSLGGGGTETGNPGMTVCATSVFEELESKDRWNPATYLAGGEQQLDPTAYLTSKPILLAKRSATLGDTIVPNLANTLYIRFQVDTLVTADTMFVRDTVYKESTRLDTLRVDAVLGTIIADQRKIDTITIWDTVITHDTVKIPRTDSILIVANPSVVNENPVIVRDTLPGTILVAEKEAPITVRISAPSLSVVVADKSVSFTIPGVLNAPQTTSNFTIRSDTGDAQLVRASSFQGSAVYERYSDGDGDGYLFKTSTSFPMRSRFMGAYATGSNRDTVAVLFDAGLDRKFPTTSDNRILTLCRLRTVGGKIIEKISYGIPSADSAFDTTALVVERSSASTAVTHAGIRYICVSGADSLDHRQNRLLRIVKKTEFQGNGAARCAVQITPDSPLSIGTSFGGGSVFAQVTHIDGSESIFDGRYDAADGTLRGVWSENGVERVITYYRATGRVDWEPR
jgi:hypothetical protein